MMFDEENDVETPNQLLRSAYQSSLDHAAENSVEKIAFSLLSAGVFRGDQSLDSILGIGVQAIRDWCQDQSPGNSSLKEVYMYAFNERESKTLRSVCDRILIPGTDDKS
jgi:O-acetyl-ADP-ribose deacetylase (regulator of RNase III)